MEQRIAAIWRIESARLIARLARQVKGDLDLAEDLAQETLLAALEQWPQSGLPDRPAGWLWTVGKRKAIDLVRRQARYQTKLELLGGNSPQDPDDDDDLGDDLLRLLFMACHPVLPPDGRVALTLRVLGGLTTDEIAHAFLVKESAVAQRIVRAKKTLSESRVAFELPDRSQLGERLSSVLEVLYLIFNEGYAATFGEHWTRPALCHEALRLGRVLAELLPAEPEVHGLVALMEIQASRLKARVDARGRPILLLDQDRGRWDPLLIRRGLLALERAARLGRGLGPYGLQAAIAACHARARRAEDTDWLAIAALYDGLSQLSPSPIVDLNRAVAVGRAFGAASGLALLDTVELPGNHLYHSVRGDLLEQLGRAEEARAEFRRAAELTQNQQERELLLRRSG